MRQQTRHNSFIASYASPLGAMTIASDGQNLTGLWFDGQKHDRSTCGDAPTQQTDLPIFHQTREWLDLYFSGRVPSFTPPLRIHGSTFRQMVSTIMCTIPFGCTLTYGKIADEIAQRTRERKISAQAVGQAVGHNPISIIIPCHRVIGRKGHLTGYAGGLSRKQALLDLEKMVRGNLKPIQGLSELVGDTGLEPVTPTV